MTTVRALDSRARRLLVAYGALGSAVLCALLVALSWWATEDWRQGNDQRLRAEAAAAVDLRVRLASEQQQHAKCRELWTRTHPESYYSALQTMDAVDAAQGRGR